MQSLARPSPGPTTGPRPLDPTIEMPPVTDDDALPRPAPARVTPNLFATAFGLAGLAECWSAAASATPVPDWPADALWILAAVVWLGTLAAYGHHVVTT